MKRKLRVKFLAGCILMIAGCCFLLSHFTFSDEKGFISNTNYTIKACEYSMPTIVLDAGHGGMDAGGVSISNVYEKDITLPIALMIGDYLTDYGYQIVYTRVDDEIEWIGEREELQRRIDLAEQEEADYYISIHLNASNAYDDGAYGFEIYSDFRNEEITQLAYAIENGLNGIGYTIDRGIKNTQETYSLYVIDQNTVPALLLELGFISDSDDFNYLNSQEGQTNIAQAIAQSIHAQLGE